jgi:hypothetical protein
MKLKINNKNENPLWKKIPCKCNHASIETEYPLIECVHCKCEEADASIPTKSFTINQPVYDKNGNIKKYEEREITEITLNNCEKYGSCLGWKF